MKFEQNGMAKDLQNTFGEFLNLLELSKSEIWLKSNQIGNDSLDTVRNLLPAVRNPNFFFQLIVVTLIFFFNF